MTDWLTVKEIAKYLNVAEITIYRFLDARKIPAHKIGNLWRFDYKEIDEWIKSGDSALIDQEK
jgi:excisionase family DNA binding protein